MLSHWTLFITIDDDMLFNDNDDDYDNYDDNHEENHDDDYSDDDVL